MYVYTKNQSVTSITSLTRAICALPKDGLQTVHPQVVIGDNCTWASIMAVVKPLTAL